MNATIYCTIENIKSYGKFHLRKISEISHVHTNSNIHDTNSFFSDQAYPMKSSLTPATLAVHQQTQTFSLSCMVKTP